MTKERKDQIEALARKLDDLADELEEIHDDEDGDYAEMPEVNGDEETLLNSLEDILTALRDAVNDLDTLEYPEVGA